MFAEYAHKSDWFTYAHMRKKLIDLGICAGELILVGAYIKGNAEILNKH